MVLFGIQGNFHGKKKHLKSIFFCGEADMFRFRVFCQFFGFDDI